MSNHAAINTTVNFNTPENFIFDNTKIQVDENGAKLNLVNKSLNHIEEFSDSGSIQFDPSKVEFINGEIRQKIFYPAGENFMARFFDNTFLSRSLGSPTPISNVNANIVNNVLDLTTQGVSYIEYNAINNQVPASKGTIRFKYTPTLSLPRIAGEYILDLSNGTGNVNRIWITHANNDQLQLIVKNKHGSNGATVITSGLVLTPGVEVEIEVGFNLIDGNNYIAVNGVIEAVTNSTAERELTGLSSILIGSYATNRAKESSFKIRDLQFFDTDLHSADFSNEIPRQVNTYEASMAIVPTITYSGLGELQSIDSVVLDSSNAPQVLDSMNGNDIDLQINFEAGDTRQRINQLTVNYTGQEYSKDNPIIKIKNAFYMTTLSQAKADIIKTGLDNVKFLMEIDSVFYWIDSNGQALSDGTYAQANTIEELQTALSQEAFEISPNAPVTLCMLIHCEDGSTSPVLNSISMEYGFYHSADSVNKCLVSGVILDGSGFPVEGAEIEADSKTDYFYGRNLITRKAIVKSDYEGKFSISLVETETTGVKVDLKISYSYKGKTTKNNYKDLTIPNKITEDLAVVYQTSMDAAENNE